MRLLTKYQNIYSMALSSDEIVKREIIETLGATYRDLRLRIFPEGSNDDQRLFTEGGLTFSKDGVDYGSCDAGWFYKKDGKDIPFIGLEGTDALNRGSSGNAQYQRFHHALGAVKNGLIGVYYLKRGVDSIRPDLYRMAVSACEHEAGDYLIIDDLEDLRPIIENYDNPALCRASVNEIIERMRRIADADFRSTYKNSWSIFAEKRSTILLGGDIVVKYAGRMIRNFTESSQRAGHIAVGEMYLSKYFFYGKKIYYLMPKMTAEDIAYLDRYKKHDKEWHLLRNEPNVEMKCIDDLNGVPSEIYQTLMRIRLDPLKGEALKTYNTCVSNIKEGLKRGKITFKQ